MIVEYIRYLIQESERREEFESAYSRAAASLDASENCLGYELSHGVEEPENYILRIEWDSQEGHEGGFRKSPEFRRFFGFIRPFVGDINEMKHYELTSVCSDVTRP